MCKTDLNRPSQRPSPKKNKLLRYFSFLGSPSQIQGSQPPKKNFRRCWTQDMLFSFPCSPDQIEGFHFIFLASCSRTQQRDSTEFRADLICWFSWLPCPSCLVDQMRSCSLPGWSLVCGSENWQRRSRRPQQTANEAGAQLQAEAANTFFLAYY
jgi:hypothetical protein